MKVFIEDPRTGETLKRCSKCEQYKKLGEYHGNKKAPHGVDSRCKICSRRRKYINKVDLFWKRFYKRTVRNGDCLEWTGTYNPPHKSPSVEWDGVGTTVPRLVYKLAIGDVPSGMYVIRTCKNHRCVRQIHLRLATNDERIAALRNSSPTGKRNGMNLYPDRRPRGERHGCAKLTESEVRAIRELCKTTMLKDIALRFRISETTIRDIVKRRTWVHVQ